MPRCSHTEWLQILNGEAGPRVRIHDRLSQIIQDLPYADSQYPSLVFFMGRQQKDIALRELYPQNNIRRQRQSNVVNIRIDNSTCGSINPALFADGDPTATVPPQEHGTTDCHSFEEQSILTPGLDPTIALLSRGLFAFTDVICLFAQDLGGVNGAAQLLVDFVRAGLTVKAKRYLRPRMLIIAPASDSPHVDEEALRLQIKQNPDIELSESFDSVKLIRLPGQYLSPAARHRRLKEELQKQVYSVHLQRVEANLLFSAVHLTHFAHEGLEQSLDTCKNFNFLKSSQFGKPVNQEFSSHLFNFLALGTRRHYSYSILAFTISTSILMDAYPPKSHCELLLGLFYAQSTNTTRLRP